MDDWASAFLTRLGGMLAADGVLSQQSRNRLYREGEPTLHIAVFVEPYLRYILERRKTIESRFGVRRSPPYGQVREGDILFLKRSGGPVCGVCKVSQVWFYRLNRSSWNEIRKQFSEALCAQDPQFWKDREAATFATLMRIENVRRLDPIEIRKRDRRGWVVIKRAEPCQLVLPS